MQGLRYRYPTLAACRRSMILCYTSGPGPLQLGYSVTRQTGSHLRLTTYEHGELRTSSRVPLFPPAITQNLELPRLSRAAILPGHTYSGFSGIGVSPRSWGASFVGIAWDEESALEECRNGAARKTLVNKEVT